MSASIRIRRTLTLAALTLLAAAAQATAAPSAHVWVTTPSGSMKMADRGSVEFATGGSDELTVSVDPSRSYQRMDGFGASITDSSAHVLYQLDSKHRAAAMASLFGTHADRLSFLRQPMGASDFVAGEHYTYDDMPAGTTDYGMRHFSVEHDRHQILPLLRTALALNPQLKVIATPWSAPAWMKTNGSLIGGRLIDDPNIYEAYARYFVRFVQAYEGAGVPIYAVTVQNEPQNRHPNAYPGMDLPVAQEAKLIEAIGPAFSAAGLDTKILGYDHNWSEHPNDIADTPPDELPAETEYPTDLLNTTAGDWITGTAFHCYFGDPSRQTALHRAFPEKGIWFTECSGSHGPTDPPAQVFSDTLKWHARNLVLGVTRNWGKTVVNWNLALDPDGGPHNGGCGTCTGVITVGPGQQVTQNAEYFTLGHLARFVRPGARRIASTSFGTTGWNGQIMDVAFRNPDGSTALVAHNENDDPRTFAVAQGGRSFEYTLPGGALATFTWPADDGLDDGYQLLDADPMSATASTSTDAANAVDDDATTRWTTGAAQSPGQWLQIDLGTTGTIRRVVLDTGADRGDFPRGYELSTSTDGSTWTPAASGAGSGQLTAISIPSTQARYVRIEQTGSAPQWWSVADVRIYG
jgi:glucosylceramidase